jgi:hypothetical protein
MCFVTPVLYCTFISFVFVCTAAKRIPSLLGTYTLRIRKY